MEQEVIPFSRSKDPYGWLSNMSRYVIKYGGVDWPSTENLFQALRFSDPAKRERIRQIDNPFLSKEETKKIAAEKWYDVEPRSEEDLDNMRVCVRLKLEQYPDLQRVLMNTDDKLLIEDVTARCQRKIGKSDIFWGMMLKDGVWTGDNWLGKIWMEERDRLNNEELKKGKQKPLF